MPFDVYSRSHLTQAAGMIPRVPGIISSSGLFPEWRGVMQTTVTISYKNGGLSLIKMAPRGGDEQNISVHRGIAKEIKIPHYPARFEIDGDEFQDKGEYGQKADTMRSLASVANEYMENYSSAMDATEELAMAMAIRGVVYDAHDDRVVEDLFDLFGVNKGKIYEHSMQFSSQGTNVLDRCLDVKRQVESKLKGGMLSAVNVYCSPGFFSKLTAAGDVRDAYRSTAKAADMLGGDNRKGFVFGGLNFIELSSTYDTKSGAKPFVPDGKAYVAVRGMNPKDFFDYVYGPGRALGATNTRGLRRYVSMEKMRHDLGVEMRMEANPLHFSKNLDLCIQLNA